MNCRAVPNVVRLYFFPIAPPGLCPEFVYCRQGFHCIPPPAYCPPSLRDWGEARGNPFRGDRIIGGRWSIAEPPPEKTRPKTNGTPMLISQNSPFFIVLAKNRHIFSQNSSFFRVLAENRFCFCIFAASKTGKLWI